jgi:hypothetical protein
VAILLVISSDDADGPTVSRIALLECDACGEKRISDSLTFLGEIHGCVRLGAFRLNGESVLVRIA